MTRFRKRLYDQAQPPPPEGLNIDYTLPFNMIIKTVKAHWDLIPVTSEYLEIRRVYNDDMVLIRVNPATAVDPCTGLPGLNDFMNTDDIELKKGDRILASFPNTDGTDCFLEIILEQV